MTDLIVFSVAKNRYAISIEHIIRIVHGENLTQVPTSHKYIDGIMSYEDSIVKVLNFRKLIEMKSHEVELLELFEKLKNGHIAWLQSLENSLKNDEPFTKATNPHLCELGKWIDSFSCYDDDVSVVLTKLTNYHQMLHKKGGEILEIYKEDKTEAIASYERDIKMIYQHTIGALDSFILELDKVSNSIQKLLIYEGKENIFAIKVDAIDDIAHVDASQIMDVDDESSSEFLDISGVLDLNGVLINVISELRLPK